jgi:hypothetical protein
LSQVVSYVDTKFEKLFVLGRFLTSKNLLPEISVQLPELKGDVLLQYYRLEKTYQGDISGIGEERSLVARNDLDKSNSPDVLITLSNVIQTINEKFRGEVSIINFSNPDLRKEITIRGARRYHEWAGSNDLPPITPGTPAENRSSFRRIIQSCKDFLYWMDLYIGKEGLEFLIDSFNKQSVKQVKLLTGLYNNENQINAELHDRFEKFQKEMKQKGISFEMQLIPTKNTYERVAHDRFIMGENIKYNVASFTTVIRGRFSEREQLMIFHL